MGSVVTQFSNLAAWNIDCVIDDWRFLILERGIAINPQEHQQCMAIPSYQNAYEYAIKLWEVRVAESRLLQYFPPETCTKEDFELAFIEASDVAMPRANTIASRYSWILDQAVIDVSESARNCLMVAQYVARWGTESLLNPAPGYVYLLKAVTGHYKIGKTKTPENRRKTFEVKLPFEVEFDHLIECRNYHHAEKLFHQRYADKRIMGEWFALDEQDVNYIKSIQIM